MTLAEKILGRKFMGFCIGLAVITVLWVIKDWGEHTFIQGLGIVFGSFMTAQAVVDFKHKPANQDDKPSLLKPEG